MKTSSYSSSKIRKRFEQFFDKSAINRIGKSSGFAVRRSQKISPYHFVLGFMLCCCQKRNTFSEWAFQIGLLTAKSVSKQGVFDRLHRGSTALAEQLLQYIIARRSPIAKYSVLFRSFGKVLLQDSTTLGLPKLLAAVFGGNTVNGEQRSQVRIQTIINVKAMHFLHFALSGFTQNDQSASGQILSKVKKGDLVIRDLGYFVSETFEALLKKEVHFLSRLRYGVMLYKPTGEAIKLSVLLKKNQPVDMEVLMGKKKIPVRLVMLPLPATQAAARKRKARSDRDKRLNHSKEYYKWLCYSVFITTVDAAIWETWQVGEAYKVRWQIEIVFKSWKSGAGMQSILHQEITAEQRVKTSIYLFLVLQCLLIDHFFIPFSRVIEKRTGKNISLLKLTTFIFNNLWDALTARYTQMMDFIVRYCCYELRHDRINMADLFK